MMTNRILSIVKKDVTQMSRNRFIAIITLLSIVLYAAIFHLMPPQVNEQYSVGLYLEKGREETEKRLSEEEGVRIVLADSLDELKTLVADEEVQAGIAFTLPESGPPKAIFYISSQTPEEIRAAGEVLAREAALNLLGYPLNAEFDEVIIGPDLVGKQIPLRDKMRILFVLFVLVTEVFALGNLISDEVRKKTAEAILVTPVGRGEFLLAKGITGLSLVIFEGFLVALLLGMVKTTTLIPLLIFLLLGGLIVVAISFILGAIGRDFLSLIGIGTILIIILLIPGIALIFPATYSPWMNAIPTYYLMRSLNGIVNYGAPFADYISDIVYLSLFSAALLLAGYFILRRRLS